MRTQADVSVPWSFSAIVSRSDILNAFQFEKMSKKRTNNKTKCDIHAVCRPRQDEITQELHSRWDCERFNGLCCFPSDFRTLLIINDLITLLPLASPSEDIDCWLVRYRASVFSSATLPGRQWAKQLIKRLCLSVNLSYRQPISGIKIKIIILFLRPRYSIRVVINIWCT